MCCTLTEFSHPQIYFCQFFGYILIYTSVHSQTYFCSSQKLAPSNDLWLYLVKICFQFGSWNMDQVILPTQISFAVKHFSPLESGTPAQQLRKKNNKKKCCIVVFPIASNFSLALHSAISWGSCEIVLHIVVTYWLTHTGLDSQLVTYSCWMTGLGHCLAKKLSQPYHLFLDYWTCLQSSDIRQPGSVPSSASVLNEKPRSVSSIQKCWEIL